jgi:hypothetical protein
MRVLSVIVISLVCVMPAFGQAQNPDDLQPGVNTSAMPAQPASAPVNAKAREVGAQVEAALAAFDRPGTAAPAAPAVSPAAPATPIPAGTSSRTAAPAKSAKTGKALDRIDLDTTQITGNKELPKVMYVVPWKRADLGDLTGKPANSLVDEVLQPVDRDVFNREERYYHAVAPEKSPAATQSGSPATH